MDVAFVSPSISRAAGGIFEAERHLASAIAHRSEIRINAVGLCDEHTKADRDAWKRVNTHVLEPIGPKNFGYSPALLKALREIAPKIVHAHGLWMYPSLATYRWACGSNRPFVVSPHGMLDPWALNNAKWKKYVVGLLYENAYLRSAACIHALNVEERDAIRSYGLTNPICVIPNGVQLPDPPEIPPPWASKIDSERNVLLYLGRIHPKKGLIELLTGWATSSISSERWDLVIIGWDDGGHEIEVRQRAEELGISSHVHFLGPRFGAEKEAAFHHASAFVLPSHSEGLPMTVLEAWSHQLPVVMTPECHLPVGFERDAALRVKPTPESIAAGLSTLAEASETRRTILGQNGLELIEDRFTWNKIAGQMHAVYRWIIHGGSAPDTVYQG